MDVQLSIQGGSAKLPALLAATAAFQDSERSGDITIKRLAGTSAGAIAAALCAIDQKPVPEACSEISTTFVKKIPKWFAPFGKAKAMYNIWRGNWLYDQNHLETILRSLIDPNLTFSQLRRPLYIIASDLESRTSRTFGPDTTPNETVFRAVLASAALPFVFVTHKSFGAPMQPLLVDGGICDNLPVAPLVANDGEARYGKAFAISFEAKSATRPTSPFDLADRIIDTSINHAVIRSKAMIGDEYVFPTRTDMEGKDFHRIAERLNPNVGEFRAIRAEALNWLQRHISSARSSASAPSTTVSTASTPNSDLVMIQAYRAFSALRERFPYTTRRLTVTFSVTSLWPTSDIRFQEHDMISQVTEIESASSLVVFGSPLGDLDGRSTDVVVVRAELPTGQQIPTEHVRALQTVTNGRNNPYLVTFFRQPPIDGNRQMVIRKTTYMRNALNYLSDGQMVDFLSVGFPRETTDTIDEVTIIVKLPESAGSFLLDAPTAEEVTREDLGDVVGNGRMLDANETTALVDGDSMGYSVLAWRSTNVPQSGATVTAAIRKRG